MLRFEQVSKRYGNGREALRDVSFQVSAGELAFITGHSGAGKSTLLRLTALIERPSRGRLLVAGTDLATLRRHHVPYHRRRLGLIFQDHRLLPGQTVFENVALPLRVCGVGTREIGRRVRAALEMVLLSDHERSLPDALSGGEQQRVGIARAVVHRPPLLLADEPTGNLDPQLSVDVMRLFEAFNRIGTTVLVATHNLALIRRLPHRVLELQQGMLR
jgi:cell division transport system ATP-binding protein